ncbi:MAG: response regulator [Flexistipes sinusarabici]|uniref:Response regulator n=1 Tax=Flexistipes sinusarabici TaxID=2352 RepID=A0A5D0MPG1_FLESI|nr:response regulator [Flexistipes sinusarabici]TYB32549.1 MAG: response regulator [Flexistipes sinusarabici]
MPTRILAIDDSETMHRLFKMIFDDNEYDLTLSDNGEEGLEFVKNYKPDIILLDFIMPKVNGFQFCKIVRNELNLDIPILLITSKAEDVGEKFIAKFANIDYIPKPFQPDEIIEKMEEMLGAKEEQAETVQEEEPETPEEPFVSETLEGEKSMSEESIETEYEPSVLTGEAPDLESKIIKSLQPHLRKLIQKMIQLETGYQEAEVKGEHPQLEDLIRVMRNGEGVLNLFNFEKTFSFNFKDGKLFFAKSSKSGVEQISEIFQHVTGVTLFKTDTFAEIYEQLKAMDISDAQIQSTFEYYTYNMINTALNLEESRYFVDENIDNRDIVDSVYINMDNLKSGFSDYLEEKAEINKIVYDDNLIPQAAGQTEGNFSELERKILSLCDGKRNAGQILKFFGNNTQMAKNSLGTLILTGFIKI